MDDNNLANHIFCDVQYGIYEGVLYFPKYHKALRNTRKCNFIYARKCAVNLPRLIFTKCNITK